MTRQELDERLTKLNDESHLIRATAEAEKRDLSVEETEQLDACLAAFDRTSADRDRLLKLEQQTEALNKPAGRKTEPAPTAGLRSDDDGNVELPRGTGRREGVWVGRLDPITSKNGGFRNLGEMALHVHRACVNRGTLDGRLERLAAASTYGNEGSGSDGGFAVPPEFRTQVMVTVMGENSLLGRCDQVTCSGNSFTCPVDETTPWQTSGGIQVTWDGEAAAGTQSKPQLQDRTVKLNKLRALVPMTEELLEDAAALNSYLLGKAPDKINFAVNKALLQGVGVGMPLGVLNSAARVTVTKESGQVANSIIAMNIIKMFNRMYGPCRPNAVWVYNQEVEPQLFKLSIPGTDNTGNFVTTWGGMVYMPPNGLSQGPFGTIFGRPAIPTQACPALSSEGDIMFIDFSQYLALLKGGSNPEVETSIHLWFDQDLIAFKFTLRLGGIPWWSVAASPLAGSNSYSPYVTLQAR